MFPGKLDQYLIYLLLFGESSLIGQRIMRLVALHLQVIVITKQILKPLNGFIGLFQPPLHDVLRYFSPQTGRAYDQTFMISFQ